jgi:hypothetical protein
MVIDKMNPVKYGNFGILPVEIISEIVFKLDYLNLRCINKSFQELADKLELENGTVIKFTRKMLVKYPKDNIDTYDIFYLVWRFHHWEVSYYIYKKNPNNHDIYIPQCPYRSQDKNMLIQCYERDFTFLDPHETVSHSNSAAILPTYFNIKNTIYEYPHPLKKYHEFYETDFVEKSVRKTTNYYAKLINPSNFNNLTNKQALQIIENYKNMIELDLSKSRNSHSETQNFADK